MPDARLARALTLAQSGAHAEAEAVLSTLCAEADHPEAPQAATLLGRLRLQHRDIDGALDVLVPAWERARRAADPAPAALVGLGLVQALIAADRALHGLRVLVVARRKAELSGNAPLVGAAADLGHALVERIPDPEDLADIDATDHADAQATRRHLRSLAVRATGDLPTSRSLLQEAWLAAEHAAPSVRAEVGLDLVQRMAADGNTAWPGVRDAARAAAAEAGDVELVAQLDSLHTPEPGAPTSDAPLDRARTLAQQGDAPAAIDLAEGILEDGAASHGDRLAARLLLAELHLGQHEADRAVAVLSPAWAQAEASADPTTITAIATTLGPALVADGRTLPGLRVLLVAHHRAAQDTDLQASLAEIATSLKPFIPSTDGEADPERRAMILAVKGLSALLMGQPGTAHTALGEAWEAAQAAGPVARAQVGLDYSGLLRAMRDNRWQGVHRAGRMAAMEAADGHLVALYDAVVKPAEA